jgi:hypothetical protein
MLLCVSHPNDIKIINRESRVFDITAGNKLDSLQNGLEACNAMQQHLFSPQSCNAYEIFSSGSSSTFLINLTFTPTDFLRVLKGSFIASSGAQHPFLLPHLTVSITFLCKKAFLFCTFDGNLSFFCKGTFSSSKRFKRDTKVVGMRACPH